MAKTSFVQVRKIREEMTEKMEEHMGQPDL